MLLFFLRKNISSGFLDVSRVEVGSLFTNFISWISNSFRFVLKAHFFAVSRALFERDQGRSLPVASRVSCAREVMNGSFRLGVHAIICQYVKTGIFKRLITLLPTC